MPTPQHSIAFAGPAAPARRRTIIGPAFGILACAAGLLAGASATARDHGSRKVGGWTVEASKDGDGCFVTKVYNHAGDTTLLLGLDLDGANHLSVLNANWSIKPDDRLRLTFQLSSGSYAKHFAIGIASNGKQGFVTSFEPKFPDYFAASKILDISRGDVPVERLNLDGSGAAVAALRNCVAAQREKPGAAAGKKAHSHDIPRDPFALDPSGKSKN